jgi:hypothetical protein
VIYTWEKAQQNVFDMLKKQFTKTPLLVFPNSSKEMHIETDTSDITTDTVLLVLGEDNSWCPCAFLSHSFSFAECNYPVYDKELLTIICTLEECQHYLIGKTNFEIWIEHKNLPMLFLIALIMATPSIN